LSAKGDMFASSRHVRLVPPAAIVADKTARRLLFPQAST
jgi:hypothetical protein